MVRRPDRLPFLVHFPNRAGLGQNDMSVGKLKEIQTRRLGDLAALLCVPSDLVGRLHQGADTEAICSSAADPAETGFFRAQAQFTKNISLPIDLHHMTGTPPLGTGRAGCDEETAARQGVSAGDLLPAPGPALPGGKFRQAPENVPKKIQLHDTAARQGRQETAFPRWAQGTDPPHGKFSNDISIGFDDLQKTRDLHRAKEVRSALLRETGAFLSASPVNPGRQGQPGQNFQESHQ